MTYTDLMAGYVTPMSPIPADIPPAGSLKPPIRAVLFDVYGTLFISQSGDISVARRNIGTASRLEALIRAYHYPGSVSELIDAFFRAISEAHEAMRQTGVDYPEVRMERIWQQVLDGAKIETDPKTDIETARRVAIEFEMIVNPCYLMPHLVEVFSALRKKGIQMGIISNAQFFTPLLFQVLLGAQPENLGFARNLVFYSYRHGVAKPSRRLYQLAAGELERMGIDAGAAVYVGNDMLNDILPAAEEGFQTALFAGDRRSLRLRSDDVRCAGVHPDLVITDWRQIKNAVSDK